MGASAYLRVRRPPEARAWTNVRVADDPLEGNNGFQQIGRRYTSQHLDEANRSEAVVCTLTSYDWFKWRPRNLQQTPATSKL
jgi:hypothetical protein